MYVSQSTFKSLTIVCQSVCLNLLKVRREVRVHTKCPQGSYCLVARKKHWRDDLKDRDWKNQNFYTRSDSESACVKKSKRETLRSRYIFDLLHTTQNRPKTLSSGIHSLTERRRWKSQVKIKIIRKMLKS